MSKKFYTDGKLLAQFLITAYRFQWIFWVLFNPHNFYFTQIDMNKNFDEDAYHYMNNTNKSPA